MKNLPEELIYVLIFAAILLVQYLMKRYAGRPQPDDALQEAPVPEAQPAEQEAPVPARGACGAEVPALSFAAAEWAARLRAPAVGAVMPRRRAAARSLLNGGTDLRRAVVGMTLLGPCRAQAPHDGR